MANEIGRTAYELRLKGHPWSAIKTLTRSERALGCAKSYAIKRGLPWPIELSKEIKSQSKDQIFKERFGYDRPISTEPMSVAKNEVVSIAKDVRQPTTFKEESSAPIKEAELIEESQVIYDKNIEPEWDF